ncbi:MAG: hypothetical protein H6590_02955 [Flavobacteriales bacterium]|nr:hypothetical protein [Flavobacteriales bacterium]
MQTFSVNNARTAVLALGLAVLAVACKKEFDTPPERFLPVGSVMTIAELKALYTGTRVHFPESKSVYAVVTADEVDGNFYKNISVEDHTGGLTLRLLNSGGLYIGDSIRIYLPGTVLAPYNGLMQLDSVDVDNNTVKQATGVIVEPLDVTTSQLTLQAMDTLQSRLIRVNDVEFEDPCGQTWANASAQTVGERFIRGCTGSSVMVRTSGYASYAGQPLPLGKGSIVCVAGIFGTTIQLSNRNMAGVQMNGTRCDGSTPANTCPFFLKNFNDGNATSGRLEPMVGQQYPVEHEHDRQQRRHRATVSARTTSTTSTCPAKSWLISPSVDLIGRTNPRLSFMTACNYNGACTRSGGEHGLRER